MKIGRISSLAVTVSFSLSFVAALRPANPVNLTVIGLRPVNLSTDLVNKDTGDGPGDLFFWITGKRAPPLLGICLSTQLLGIHATRPPRCAICVQTIAEQVVGLPRARNSRPRLSIHDDSPGGGRLMAEPHCSGPMLGGCTTECARGLLCVVQPD